MDGTTGGDCSCRVLQGAFKEDFIDGHSSEVIEAMLCSKRLLDIFFGQGACTYRNWSLERHEGGMAMVNCKRSILVS